MTHMRWVLLVIATAGNLLGFWLWKHDIYWVFVLSLLYTIVGLHDVLISKRSLNHLYPVAAHIRYFLESFHDEIHQYFVAGPTDERPFNREQRSVVYRRAKGVDDYKPFGTDHDITDPNYINILHSMVPVEVDESTKRVVIGQVNCRQPYSASRFNVSAMSYGALSKNAIRALNLGAAKGGFYHNTGEGGISPYHLQGGDLVWQIGSGLFGCRDLEGEFSPELFASNAKRPTVKMIEIKLSQGAKPGHGGVLPAAKVTREIAQIRNVKLNEDCVSPANHPFCESPEKLLEWIAKLRDLSGGKPIGFKMCLGKPSEFLSIVKAMLKTGITPDFITIDGAEGGTGAAPLEFTNRFGLSCLESTVFVDNALRGANLRDSIKLIAAGKTVNGFDLLAKLAAGADLVNSARTMMMALGCIQSLSCNTNHCPTGIATQDPKRQNALDVPSKSERVYRYQKATVHHFFEMLGAMGLRSPEELTPDVLKRRKLGEGLELYSTGLAKLDAGQLLDKNIDLGIWSQWWNQASTEKF